MSERRIVVGISGSSGAALGLRFLEALRDLGHAPLVVVTETAAKIMKHETGRTPEDLRAAGFSLCDNADFFSAVASGSFRTLGMAVVPCSMKTLAGIASGYSHNLLLRAADVCLKERKRLVLVARETPLSLIHIENMRRVTLAGATVLPPVLTMYSKPESIERMIDHIVGKILDAMDIENSVYPRWGMGENPAKAGGDNA